MPENCPNCCRNLRREVRRPGSQISSIFKKHIGKLTCVLCQSRHSQKNRQFTPSPIPSPRNHAPRGSLPSPNGNRRAVICGISYRKSPPEIRLKGCINDAKSISYLLTNQFKFPESSIIMLTEEETDRNRHPTKQNIRTALKWLVQGCQPGDSLWFHFSGHGIQQESFKEGDELDGKDEALCPSDFETEGVIVDNEINATIVKPLPHGVKLHAVVDACHSGTALDLPFLCRMNRKGEYEWEDHRPESGAHKGTNGGEAILFSGCDDHELSADTDVSKTASTGVMTYSFIEAIGHEVGQAVTYGSILNSMRSTIKRRNGGGNLLSKLCAGVIGNRQEPQLTTCEPFDVYTKTFSL